EVQIREVFASFQKAITARDGDKLWDLIDADSQSDAKREAKKVREAFDKTVGADKAEQEKALGLSAAELTALKGPGFLKSKRFCWFTGCTREPPSNGPRTPPTARPA